jgi:RimJ/RimL family protein N-acetyltransferase
MNNENLWNLPVTLTGKEVRLEPLSRTHIHDLAVAGRDESIWKYMLYANLSNEPAMGEWVEDLLKRQKGGTDLPFAAVHLQSGRVVGATRFLEMRPEHLSLEIGGTWYDPEFQRTAVNTECKYLLLSYAFEKLKCIRVQFKSDKRNIASIRAIERLGAVQEGVLRNHYILPDGTLRDSVFFSILDKEWPGIKLKLEEILAR